MTDTTVQFWDRDAAARRVRLVREAIADAHILAVVALLTELDPDGEWDVRQGSQALRRAALDWCEPFAEEDDALDPVGLVREILAGCKP